VIVVAHGHAHPSLRLSILVVGHAGKNGDFSERAVALVFKQIVSDRVVSYVKIGVAVVVVVAPEDSQTVGWKYGHSCFAGDIREGAITVVVVENIRRSDQTFRSAMHFDATILAVRCRGTLRIEVDIVRDIEIQPPIAVVICKSSTGAPVGITYSGLLCHV